MRKTRPCYLKSLGLPTDVVCLRWNEIQERIPCNGANSWKDPVAPYSNIAVELVCMFHTSLLSHCQYMQQTVIDYVPCSLVRLLMLSTELGEFVSSLSRYLPISKILIHGFASRTFDKLFYLLRHQCIIKQITASRLSSSFLARYTQS